MKLIIDVPDDFYERMIEENGMSYIDAEVVVNAFYKGTILPKGHGRLIDADVLISEIKDLKKSPWYKDNANFAYLPRKEALEIVKEVVIDEAPTIIEADKEGSGDA